MKIILNTKLKIEKWIKDIIADILAKELKNLNKEVSNLQQKAYDIEKLIYDIPKAQCFVCGKGIARHEEMIIWRDRISCSEECFVKLQTFPDMVIGLCSKCRKREVIQ